MAQLPPVHENPPVPRHETLAPGWPLAYAAVYVNLSDGAQLSVMLR